MVCYYIYIINSAHRLVLKLKIIITFKTKANYFLCKRLCKFGWPKVFLPCNLKIAS